MGARLLEKKVGQWKVKTVKNSRAACSGPPHSIESVAEIGYVMRMLCYAIDSDKKAWTAHWTQLSDFGFCLAAIAQPRSERA